MFGEKLWAKFADARVRLLLLLLMVLATLFARLWRLDVPFERDEGEYAYIAQLLLDGVPLYQEAYTMKLPGVPLVYAAAFALLGEGIAGPRVFAMLADVLTAACCYWVWRRLAAPNARLFGSEVAAATWLMLCMPNTHGFFANCEKFAMAAVMTAVVGLTALLSATRGRWWMLAVGLSCAAAVWMKQHAALLLVGALVALVPQLPRVRAIATLVSCVFVGAASLGGLAFHCVRGGTFDAFSFYVFRYAAAYVGASDRPLGYFVEALEDAQVTPLFLLSLTVVWALTWIGLAASWPRLRFNAELRALVENASTQANTVLLRLTLLLLWSGVAAASVGLWFRPHYFVLMVPGLALSLGMAVTLWPRLVPAVPILSALTLLLNAGDLWWRDNQEVNVHTFDTKTFVHAVDVGSQIAQILSPEERFLVIGNEPELFFYSHRRSVTPYIYFYPLHEQQPFRAAQRREVLDAIERASPRVVAVQGVEWALWRNDPELAPTVEAIAQRYKRVWPADGAALSAGPLDVRTLGLFVRAPE